MRILVADDDYLMRTFVAVCLQDMAAVRQAANGAETMNTLNTEPIDLLLLDWDMPAPDGLAVLKLIRESGFRTPAIMVTAQSGKARVIEALKAGVADYVIKPFDAETLRAKVRRFFNLPVPQPVTR